MQCIEKSILCSLPTHQVYFIMYTSHLMSRLSYLLPTFLQKANANSKKTTCFVKKTTLHQYVKENKAIKAALNINQYREGCRDSPGPLSVMLKNRQRLSVTVTLFSPRL